MGANLGKTTKFCSKHTFWGKVAENQDFIKEKSKVFQVFKFEDGKFQVFVTEGGGIGSFRNQKWRIGSFKKFS